MDTKNIKSDLRSIYNNNPENRTIQDLTVVIDDVINMVENLERRLSLIEHPPIPIDLPNYGDWRMCNLKIPKNNIPKEKFDHD